MNRYDIEDAMIQRGMNYMKKIIGYAQYDDVNVLNIKIKGTTVSADIEFYVNDYDGDSGEYSNKNHDFCDFEALSIQYEEYGASIIYSVENFDIAYVISNYNY